MAFVGAEKFSEFYITLHYEGENFLIFYRLSKQITTLTAHELGTNLEYVKENRVAQGKF